MFSDSWVEQGQSRDMPKSPTTITLPIAFVNTNWILVTEVFGVVDKNFGEGISVQTKTATNFIAHGYHSSAIINIPNSSWVAFGQGVVK